MRTVICVVAVIAVVASSCSSSIYARKGSSSSGRGSAQRHPAGLVLLATAVMATEAEKILDRRRSHGGGTEGRRVVDRAPLAIGEPSRKHWQRHQTESARPESNRSAVVAPVWATRHQAERFHRSAAVAVLRRFRRREKKQARD